MSEEEIKVPGSVDLLEAVRRIAPLIHRTPILTCRTLNDRTGGELYFKCENFQKIGAFKIRGAANAVLSLSDDEAARGVATHSSGNHAQAIAFACRARGVRAAIVMPENSQRVKVEAVRGYGAEVFFCGPRQRDREETLTRVLEDTGAVLVHPYDDNLVIAGQGTAALELLEDAPALDILMAPVGGGGLLSGTSLAVCLRSPDTAVIGAEPENADDAFRSLRDGVLYPQPSGTTIADGLRTGLSPRTFSIIRTRVRGIATASEESIIFAMRLLWERMKILVEPSAAVPLAALLEKKFNIQGMRVGIILSGGNVDLDNLPW